MSNFEIANFINGCMFSAIIVDVHHVEINLLIYVFVERKCMQECDGNNFYCNVIYVYNLYFEIIQISQRS